MYFEVTPKKNQWVDFQNTFNNTIVALHYIWFENEEFPIAVPAKKKTKSASLFHTRFTTLGMLKHSFIEVHIFFLILPTSTVTTLSHFLSFQVIYEFGVFYLKQCEGDLCWHMSLPVQSRWNRVLEMRNILHSK